MHIKLKARDMGNRRTWHQGEEGRVGTESAIGERYEEMGREGGREENSQTTQGDTSRPESIGRQGPVKKTDHGEEGGVLPGVQ